MTRTTYELVKFTNTKTGHIEKHLISFCEGSTEKLEEFLKVNKHLEVYEEESKAYEKYAGVVFSTNIQRRSMISQAPDSWNDKLKRIKSKLPDKYAKNVNTK